MFHYVKCTFCNTKIVFLLALIIFGVTVYGGYNSDIKQHVYFIKKAINGDILAPANFLYYLSVYVLSGCSSNTKYLFISAILLLSFSVALKFFLTKKISLKYLKETDIDENLVSIFSFCMIFLFSFPFFNFYIGQTPPNVWHNSTTIFVMPFSLILFWISYKNLFSPSKKKYIYSISFLCIINILIKPSFFFVFGVTYPIMVLYQFKAKQIVKNLIPVIVGFSFLLIEYLLIYKYSYGDYSSTKSTVIIDPFCVWSRYTPCIFISVILSVFFPLAYILIYFKEARQNNLLKYAVFSFFVSIVIYSLFAESGPKKFDANFSWQAIICSYILFWVTGLEFLKKISKGLKTFKEKILLSIFFLHVLAGLLYLAKFFFTNNYL